MFIFDLESGALANTYSSHAMAVRSLAWSYDGQVSPIRFLRSMWNQLRCLAVTPHSLRRQAAHLARRPFHRLWETWFWCRRDAHRPLILGSERGHLPRWPARRLWVCILIFPSCDTMVSPHVSLQLCRQEYQSVGPRYTRIRVHHPRVG